MTVIGIDFGNQNICISKINNGNVEIISNESGKKNIINMISFNSTRMYGTDALNVITKNMNSNLLDIHTLIQNSVETNVLQPLCKFEDSYYQIEFMNQIYKIRKEHIIVMIFNYIKKIAGNFSECVISIPSFMGNYEKEIFINASKIVKVNILSFVNNSISAAVNYNFYNFLNDKKDSEKSVEEDKKGEKYIFLNIGENHTSVSIIKMEKNNLEIINQQDSKEISGKEIDFLLMEHFANKFYQKYKIDIKQNYKSITKLKKECEKIKKVLSINKHYKTNLEYFYKETDFEFSISREEFEKLILKKSILLKNMIQNCINISKIKKEDINSIELIGGGCRIPILIKNIKELNIPVKTSLNLDESVSKGCCLLGAMVSNYIQTSNNIDINYSKEELYYQFDDLEIIKSKKDNQINFNTRKKDFKLTVFIGRFNKIINFTNMEIYKDIKNISISVSIDLQLQMIKINKIELETDKENINITEQILNYEFEKISSEVKNIEYNITELELIIEKKYLLQNSIEETFFYLEEKKGKYSFLISEQNLNIINQMDDTIDNLYNIDNVNTYEEIFNQITNIKENLDYRIYEYENIDKYSEKLRKNIDLCLKDIKKRNYLAPMAKDLKNILTWVEKKLENKQENMKNSSFTTKIISKKINEITQKRKDLHIAHKKLLKEIKSKKEVGEEEEVGKEK